jgi:hypothetical protein
MKFEITVARAVAGNDIGVHVEADGTQQISQVQVVLDDFEIGNDQLDEGTTVYDRAFSQVGEAGSGTDHRLVVAAFLPDGTRSSATKIWKDLV